MAFIREPAVSGTFYPANSATLRRDVQNFLDNVPKTEISGTVTGIVAPHAGYVYSGQVAAYAYRAVVGASYDTVVVIAPSHRAYFPGVAVLKEGSYRTPIGLIEIDEELAQATSVNSSMIQPNLQAHSGEHSLEVQLPFLQVVLKKFRLLPLIMGVQDMSTCHAVAEAVFKASSKLGREILVVGSTDLSHYHGDRKAVALDSVVVKHLQSFDETGLMEDVAQEKCEACGAGPMVVAMMLSKLMGATESRVLKYAHSEMFQETKARSSAMFQRSLSENSHKGRNREMNLNEEEKEKLKKLVRETIESVFAGKEPKMPEPSDRLQEKRGAFVTIKNGGQLRGCIGHIKGVTPLAHTIKEMAVQAAFHDPRFHPLDKKELEEIEIEISVLTPLKKITDTKEIQVGVHGIYMEKGFHAGLLLPQVATEYGWDRATFLEYTCLKAGLPKNAYKEKDINIYIFSADVF